MFKCVFALAVAMVLAGPALAANVGPDALGYRITSQVPLVWEDISGTGTKILATSDDGYVHVPDIGFNFQFAGATYRDMSICANGHIVIGQDTNYSYSNYPLPYSGASNFIAPFWDDLINNKDAEYYQTLGAPGSRRFVVQWNNIDHYSSTTTGATFSATFFEATGYIAFQYHNIVFGDATYDYGMNATVGIQENSTTGLQWSYDQASLSNGMGLLITPEPATLTLLALGGLAVLARRRARR